VGGWGIGGMLSGKGDFNVNVKVKVNVNTVAEALGRRGGVGCWPGNAASYSDDGRGLAAR